MEVPWLVRFFLVCISALNANGVSLLSFLLFEKTYCRELIQLGYKDAMQRKDELIKFIEAGD